MLDAQLEPSIHGLDIPAEDSPRPRTMPLGMRRRIMKRPGVRLKRLSRPVHLRRELMSKSSISL